MAQQATPATVAWPSPASGGSDRRTTVVVGVDGSDTSWSALWWACGEAQRLSGRVIAVYVTCTHEATVASAALTTGFDAGAYATAAELTHRQQAAELRAKIQRITADLEIEISFIHALGDTAEELLRAAHTTHADLIAVGRSTKLRHHLAGSLGRRLARNKKAPIVVIVP
jgi:nucleotide-binding universal stress UspA family protein